MLDSMSDAGSWQARLAVPSVPVPRRVPVGMAPARPHRRPADRGARDPAQHGDGRGCGHASSAAIALLAAADTIVSSKAFSQRNGYEVNANRDLLGLGSANLASGLSGGITTSASAARTAVVEMVGGRSQLASLTAAIGMLVVLLFVTEPLENLPTTALAAVVIGAVLRLIELSSLRALADPSVRPRDRDLHDRRSGRDRSSAGHRDRRRPLALVEGS